jgi:ABC-type proline/glycine betaine transport system permease subunit
MGKVEVSKKTKIALVVTAVAVAACAAVLLGVLLTQLPQFKNEDYDLLQLRT